MVRLFPNSNNKVVAGSNDGSATSSTSSSSSSNPYALAIAVLGILAGIWLSTQTGSFSPSSSTSWLGKWSKQSSSLSSSSSSFKRDPSLPARLTKAVDSYTQYEKLAKSANQRRRQLLTSLPSRHYKLLDKANYKDKLTKLDQAIETNAILTRQIASFSNIPTVDVNKNVPIDLGRVRESLQHFSRDWSKDGQDERDAVFTPLIKQLDSYFSNRIKTGQIVPQVLVPGAGHCRLAYDISQNGYNVVANENSYFMTLATRFLFSREYTPSVEYHTVKPWIHWQSHQYSTESTTRSVKFPDILPVPLNSTESKLTIVEDDFVTGLIGQENHYDAIVTLFFIDTAVNVVQYLEKIHSLLKPGGVWINLGPFLWAGSAKVELNMQEVIELARQIGFNLDTEPQVIPTEYTSDSERLMKYIYKTGLWSFSKRP